MEEWCRELEEHIKRHGHHDHAHAPWVRPRADFPRPTTLWGKVKHFLWGFFMFEFWHELQHEKHKYKDVMTIILYGELIGIPLMASNIGLRLLPFMFPELQSWKHRALEEFDVTHHGPHVH